MSGAIKVSNQYREMLGIGMKQSGQYKMSEESWIKRNGVYQKYLDKSIPPEPEIIAGASIHTLLGSPTTPGDYTWVNYNVMQVTTQGGVGLTTGVFPAGSTLTIINHGDIAGGGGNGNGGNGGVGGNGGQVGGTAGFAVRKNGYNLTWISGNTAPNVYGNIG